MHDNMKTAVETIFVGKKRAIRRRFLQFAAASRRSRGLYADRGLGEGAVRKQVGALRERYSSRSCE
jgi:hypothetical protein